jgi:hypothetical protein
LALRRLQATLNLNQLVNESGVVQFQDAASSFLRRSPERSVKSMVRQEAAA